ncbi:fumarate/nitrate reduction transcriptional regulator Fnr [Psychrosphaera aestuarii]|uniref:fumarate/nitrate reduction transcriptional regulator Fnr n=1 Tax=Psychrosphaera aestuarii TaxID=1266052 RepID=UPI001B342A40|nr:fumarate/nitrate reduction transcriptional regulator Fnr [Psychrosphaera aestuarii]
MTGTKQKHNCGAFSISCTNCNLNQLCIPFTLDDNELRKLDDLIQRKKPYQKSQTLFDAGQPLKTLYAVRSGSFKSYLVDNDGTEQITAFHLPGDIIGFDALSTNKHITFAQALETSMVCEIPFTTVEDLSGHMPNLRQQITRLMSSEISNDQAMFMLLNKKSAEQRICSFIASLSNRFSERSLSSTTFRLPMTRAEIGNYLGLTVETVSRIFSKLQKLGVISIDGKFITVLDLPKVENLVN